MFGTNFGDESTKLLAHLVLLLAAFVFLMFGYSVETAWRYVVLVVMGAVAMFYLAWKLATVIYGTDSWTRIALTVLAALLGYAMFCSGLARADHYRLYSIHPAPGPPPFKAIAVISICAGLGLLAGLAWKTWLEYKPKDKKTS